jgi:acetyl-CoA C-acetyltransferase
LTLVLLSEHNKRITLDVLKRRRQRAMEEVVIVSAVRTAIGGFGGALKGVPVVELGALTIREALKRAGLRPTVSDALKALGPDPLKGLGPTELQQKIDPWPDDLQPVYTDEVIMGNVVSAGQGQNPGRQAGIRAGMPVETNAITINKVCASGMKAVALADQSIRAGQAEVVVAGGMENMSNIPYTLPDGRWGARMFDKSMVDLMVHDGLWEIFYGYHMGVTAENIAKTYGISREEQDKLGLLSHQRARKAIEDGIFAEEIVTVEVPQRKKDPLLFDTDERPMDTSLEKMGKLPPAFVKKDGTVTAGNASGINDASAALVVMSRTKADALGVKPLARIVGYASGGVDPAYMGLGPIPSVRKVLAKTGVSLSDVSLFELNEAFASQAIACMRELELDPEKTNVHGSGISLGHPIGCSGARILVTLIHEMRRRDVSLGLASLCIGGGQGMAMILEAV